jgi:hypothetical protein
MGDVGSSFASAGRFGGGSYVDSATNALTSGLGALDTQHLQQQQDNIRADLSSALSGAQQASNIGAQGTANISTGIGNLSSLYSALQAPAATQGLVGSAQDQAAQAQANGQNNNLLSLLAALNGASGTAGTTTTTSTPAPSWWQAGLGTALAFL